MTEEKEKLVSCSFSITEGSMRQIIRIQLKLQEQEDGLTVINRSQVLRAVVEEGLKAYRSAYLS